MKRRGFFEVFERSGGLLTFLLVIGALILNLIFQKVIGELSLLHLILAYLGILGACGIAVFVAHLYVHESLDLHAQARYLQRGLEELSSLHAVLVSDDMLKDVERKAERIRIISPDLHDDQNGFYKTVLANVRASRTYEYVIPDRPELISKMDRLLEHLQRDAGITDRNQLNEKVAYRVCSDYPIILEYVVYDGPEFDGLKGFVEIRLGPGQLDNTNVPLNERDTYQLNRWFDKIFQHAPD